MTRQIKVRATDSDGGILYTCPTFSFDVGLTFIVGCNGSGKTTLMERIDDEFRWGKVDGVVSRRFRCADIQSPLDGFLMGGGSELAATMLMSSEGERMAQALVAAFDWMWEQNRNDGVKEIWMMLDSLDSGIDIPTLKMIRGVLDDVPQMVSKDLYIIVSANSYALIEGRECLDVSTAKRLTFRDWTDYARFCERSHEKKDRRYEMEAAKSNE